MARRSHDRKRREGSNAIEFGLVALPFFLLLFGILEIGLMLLVDAMVETAASDAARQVRTGQAQTQELTPEQFKDKFCAEMSLFSGDCGRRAFIDVRVLDDFSLTDPSKAPPDPTSGDLFDPAGLKFEPGGPGERVLVRIWYEQPIITPVIAQAVSRTKDGRVMLTTTLAFRNEPYQ
ncbi:TadE/TadG family type IV pilus assembly protein [Brevundimonas naejangsanensis]|uniref:TadE/TadG family type IV pilus assembly protein n=1 Tax=Brevundimonas naejangsanensis TaxID=588932 RepID=UPI00320B10C0